MGKLCKVHDGSDGDNNGVKSRDHNLEYLLMLCNIGLCSMDVDQRKVGFWYAKEDARRRVSQK